jgi:hypothetical protein
MTTTNNTIDILTTHNDQRLYQGTLSTQQHGNFATTNKLGM